MSMTPIASPGSPDPEPGLSEDDVSAAFDAAFRTEDPTPPVEPPMTSITEIPDDVISDDVAAPAPAPTPAPAAEGGEGGGEPSPLATPDSTPSSEPPPDPTGGATDFVPPADPTSEDITPDPDLTGATGDAIPGFAQDAPIDLNEMFSAYQGGEPVTYQQGKEILGLVDGIYKLPEAYQTAVNGMLQGASPAEIAEYLQQAAGITPTAPVAPAPAPTDDPIFGGLDDGPTTASLPPEVQAQLDRLEAANQQRELAQQQQWQNWVTQESTAGFNEFVGLLPVELTPGELAVLEQQALKSGVFALEMQATNGQNPREAWKKTLGQTLYANETFRAKIVEAEAAKQAATTSTVAARTSAAASVVAGGSAVPTPLSKTPLTPQEAMASAAAEADAVLRQGMGG